MSSILDAVTKDSARSGGVPGAAPAPAPPGGSGGSNRFRAAALVVVFGVAVGAIAARMYGGESSVSVEEGASDMLTDKVERPEVARADGESEAVKETIEKKAGDAEPGARREDTPQARAIAKRKEMAATAAAARRKAATGEASPADLVQPVSPAAEPAAAPPVPAAAPAVPAAVPAAPQPLVIPAPPSPARPGIAESPGTTPPAAPPVEIARAAPVALPPDAGAPGGQVIAPPDGTVVVPVPANAPAVSALPVPGPADVPAAGPVVPPVVPRPVQMPPAIVAAAPTGGAAAAPPVTLEPDRGEAAVAAGDGNVPVAPPLEVSEVRPMGAPEVSILFVAWSRVPAERVASMRVAAGSLSVVHEGEYVEGLQVSAIHPEAVDLSWTGQKFRVAVNPF